MRPTWERDPHTRLDLVERLKGLPDGITIRIVRLAPGLDYDVTVIAPRTAPMPAGGGGPRAAGRHEPRVPPCGRHPGGGGIVGGEHGGHPDRFRHGREHWPLTMSSLN